MSSGHASRPTQRQRVLDYIRKHGSIDRRTAVIDLGIFELSARIIELEMEGHRFGKERKQYTAVDGHKGSFTIYRLEGED